MAAQHPRRLSTAVGASARVIKYESRRTMYRDSSYDGTTSGNQQAALSYLSATEVP